MASASQGHTSGRNRLRAIKNTTSPVVVYTKVHGLPISVVGKDDDGEDRCGQQDLLGRRVAHAASLSNRRPLEPY